MTLGIDPKANVVRSFLFYLQNHHIAAQDAAVLRAEHEDHPHIHTTACISEVTIRFSKVKLVGDSIMEDVRLL